MKKYLIIASLPILLFLFLAIGFSGRAAAFDPFHPSGDPNAVCKNASTEGESPVCAAKGSKNPLTDNDGVITKIANIFAGLTGIAAVVLIIIGGFEYVRSSGDSTKVNKAKNTILFAVIGLVVVALARSIVALAVDKL